MNDRLPTNWINTPVHYVVLNCHLTGYVQYFDSERQRYGVILPPRLLWVSGKTLVKHLGTEHART